MMKIRCELSIGSTPLKLLKAISESANGDEIVLTASEQVMRAGLKTIKEALKSQLRELGKDVAISIEAE